jgi:hypothetical protein
VIVADPFEPEVTRPVLFTVATLVLEELQLALLVTSSVELSLYFAVALSCFVPEEVNVHEEGSTVTEETVLGG